MIKITFELNGKPVEPGNLGDAFQAAVLESVRDQIGETLAGVRCPDHGEAPTVVCRGRTLDELRFDVSGCCDKVIAATQAALE